MRTIRMAERESILKWSSLAKDNTHLKPHSSATKALHMKTSKRSYGAGCNRSRVLRAIRIHLYKAISTIGACLVGIQIFHLIFSEYMISIYNKIGSRTCKYHITQRWEFNFHFWCTIYKYFFKYWLW